MEYKTVYSTLLLIFIFSLSGCLSLKEKAAQEQAERNRLKEIPSSHFKTPSGQTRFDCIDSDFFPISKAEI